MSKNYYPERIMGRERCGKFIDEETGSDHYA